MCITEQQIVRNIKFPPFKKKRSVKLKFYKTMCTSWAVYLFRHSTMHLCNINILTAFFPSSHSKYQAYVHLYEHPCCRLYISWLYHSTFMLTIFVTAVLFKDTIKINNFCHHWHHHRVWWSTFALTFTPK